MRMREPVNVIILGDVLSGKTTQAKLLAKKHRLRVLDMGKELRGLPPAVFKKRGVEVINKARLAPTDLVKEIIDKWFAVSPRNRGLLLAGPPRLPGEARKVVGLLKKRGQKAVIIYIYLSKAEALRRARLRRREDDRPEVVAKRWSRHRQALRRVVPILKSEYPYARIPGAGTIERKFRRIEAFIGKHSK